MKVLSVIFARVAKSALLKTSLCLCLLMVLLSAKSMAQPGATLIMLSKGRSIGPNVISDQAEAKIILSEPAPAGGLDVYLTEYSATMANPYTWYSWSQPIHFNQGQTEYELTPLNLNYWEFSDYIEGENIGLIYQYMSQWEVTEHPTTPTAYYPYQTTWYFDYYNTSWGNPGPL